MQLRGHGHEVRVGGGRHLELLELVGGTRLAVDEHAADVVGEDPDSVDVADREAGLVQQLLEPLAVEAPRHGVSRAPPPVGVIEHRMRISEMSGQGSTENSPGPLHGEQAEAAVGTQYGCHRGQRLVGRIDDLEHPMAGDGVDGAGADHLDERVGIAEDTADGAGDADFGCAPLEGGECIGTRVDDDHLVSEFGDPDREATGAAAEVDDLERPVGMGCSSAVEW